MSIKLKGATSGSIELDVPDAIGSDLSVTLPATAGEIVVANTSGDVDLGALTVSGSAADDSVNVDSSGRLLVGTTSALDTGMTTIIKGSSGGTGVMVARASNPASGQSLGTIYVSDHQGGIGAYVDAARDGGTWTSGSSHPTFLRFATTADGASSPTERMRITSDGYVRFFTNSGGSPHSNQGVEINSSGYLYGVRDSGTVHFLNRRGSDGKLVEFRHDGTTEGSISVSGTTVSYNGAHLSRLSQLAGNAERTEILRGSVLSNLDEMCEWAYEAKTEVLWTEDDELPEGVSVGDVKEPAHAAGTEDNEQLNRMKVSDVEGDPNVSGVFQSWDDDDDTYTNDFYCAMTGDFVIRIAQGTTVARGDLLMSAGDGTAKPQDDDIVRSKTIAKVTSTTVSCTYDDGSYCVPCVLMAC